MATKKFQESGGRNGSELSFSTASLNAGDSKIERSNNLVSKVREGANRALELLRVLKALLALACTADELRAKLKT